MTTLVSEAAKAVASAHELLVARPGGGFLVAPVARGGTFTRERLSEEQQLLTNSVRDFWKSSVVPRIEEIEHKKKVEVDGKEQPLAIVLLRQLAELGALGTDIPGAYGGLDLDKTTSMLLSETLGGCASMGATVGAHIGIGTLPIVFFGNEEQKQKYLPRLQTAEIVSCYALTEPNNGSDALGGRTTAMLSKDGSHYVLSGEKIFITNGTWADIAVVFARHDGGPYSAFIVDLHSPGVTRGVEERKMGIRGSSTTGLTFSDVKVPKENMLGNVGDAARIALNILYLGRLKLGFGDLGNAKYAFDLTLKFAKERKQFGQPVASFDMQKSKIAEMAAWIYALDAVCYRTVGRIDEECAKRPEGTTPEEWTIEVTRRFGVECSITKVLGSEVCSKVCYHAVRIHGGYGFVEEYQVERLTRDNVVSTIYEGTNDINRLVISGDLVKNIYGGTVPFREFLEDVKKRLTSGKLVDSAPEGPLGMDHARLAAAKRALGWVVERTLLGVGKDVRVLQQPLVAVSDALTALYAAESAYARAFDRIAAGAGEDEAALAAIVGLSVHDACREIRERGSDILASVTPCEKLDEERATFARLAGAFDIPVDTYRLKRVLADRAVEVGHYPY